MIQRLYIFPHWLLSSTKWNYFYSVFPAGVYVSHIIPQDGHKQAQIHQCKVFVGKIWIVKRQCIIKIHMHWKLHTTLDRLLCQQEEVSFSNSSLQVKSIFWFSASKHVLYSKPEIQSLKIWMNSKMQINIQLVIVRSQKILVVLYSLDVSGNKKLSIMKYSKHGRKSNQYVCTLSKAQNPWVIKYIIKNFTRGKQLWKYFFIPFRANQDYSFASMTIRLEHENRPSLATVATPAMPIPSYSKNVTSLV